MSEESPQTSSHVTEEDLGDLPCLTGNKPFLDVFISKSHLGPKYQLVCPYKYCILCQYIDDC